MHFALWDGSGPCQEVFGFGIWFGPLQKLLLVGGFHVLEAREPMHGEF